MKQSELKAILKHHKLWIQSGGAKGKGADLRGADLRCAHLQDADLRCAHLQGANLQCANLQYAKLQCANLQDADLQCADLEGANLEDANLRYANLLGANLQDAYLLDAYLEYAYLQDAKFTTNFKKTGWFDGATFSEDQIPWVVLHPRYPKWAGTLKWVPAKSKQVAGSSEQAIVPVSAGDIARPSPWRSNVLS